MTKSESQLVEIEKAEESNAARFWGVCEVASKGN